MVFGIFGAKAPNEAPSSDLNRLVIEPATRLYNDLSSKWEALGKSVADWTDKNVPKEYQPFIKRIFAALPVALVTAVLPLYASVPLAIGCYIAHIAYGPFKESTYDSFYVGCALGCSLKSTFNIASFLVTFHPLYALSSSLYAVATMALLKKSNLLA